jgi:hypothetical protein
MLVRTGTWQPGATPPAADRLTLRLANVGALTVDAAAARLPHGEATVTTDGPTVVTVTGLTGLAAGSTRFQLPAGTSTVTW